MVRAGRLRHRVLAILAVTVTVAAAVAIAPAAHARSPYEVSDGELKVVCAAFQGAFSDSRTGYACTLFNSTIDCLSETQSCKYLTETSMPKPFAEDCATVRGAKFTVIDELTFGCFSGDWTVLTSCPDGTTRPEEDCDVGVILSEPPVR
jgi:hypothetical protein